MVNQVLSVMGVFAEFERTLNRERKRGGHRSDQEARFCCGGKKVSLMIRWPSFVRAWTAG